MLREKLSIKGEMRIELIDVNTSEPVFSIDIANKIMQFARNRYLKQLAGDTAGFDLEDLKIKFMAFGDGDTTPNINDTKLVNERYRQQITAKTLSEDSLMTTVSVSPYVEASNFNIKEIGIFCGTAATTEKDSGFLLARVVVNIDKNSNTVLNVTRYDIVTI